MRVIAHLEQTKFSRRRAETEKMSQYIVFIDYFFTQSYKYHLLISTIRHPASREIRGISIFSEIVVEK